ncbi:MAG: hypothetical protein WB975_14125, partial [Nitrososphaeraceae archaeon]
SIYQCSICELYIIEGEDHKCPLNGARQIGFTFINKEWFIHYVLIGDVLGEHEAKTIQPIPIPSYLKSDGFLQRDKNGRNPTETGQNLCSHKTKISLVISLAI